jgi:hypothetical protein
MRRDKLKHFLIVECQTVTVCTGCMAQIPPNNATSRTPVPGGRLPGRGEAPTTVTDFSRLVSEDGPSTWASRATAGACLTATCLRSSK